MEYLKSLINNYQSNKIYQRLVYYDLYKMNNVQKRFLSLIIIDILKIECINLL